MRSCIFYYVVSLSCSVNSLYSMWATWRACRDKACTHCSAIHSGQLDRLKKPCEKKSSTTDTEEVHNANSFPNTTDCFHHNEGKQPLLLSSTSTNNTLTKPPNPRFVPRQNPLDRLNAPRVEKSSFSFLPLFLKKEKYNLKKAKGKKEMASKLIMELLLVTWQPSLCFQEKATGWNFNFHSFTNQPAAFTFCYFV